MSNYIKEVTIISLTSLGIFAMWKGIDSGILVTIASAIAGLGGYELGKRTKGPNSG